MRNFRCHLDPLIYLARYELSLQLGANVLEVLLSALGLIWVSLQLQEPGLVQGLKT